MTPSTTMPDKTTKPDTERSWRMTTEEIEAWLEEGRELRVTLAEVLGRSKGDDAEQDERAA